MATATFEIYMDAAGRFRWRLLSGDRHVVASSGESYTSAEAAKRAAKNLERQVADADVVSEAA